jgi:hypothetical protein
MTALLALLTAAAVQARPSAGAAGATPGPFLDLETRPIGGYRVVPRPVAPLSR